MCGLRYRTCTLREGGNFHAQCMLNGITEKGSGTDDLRLSFRPSTFRWLCALFHLLVRFAATSPAHLCNQRVRGFLSGMKDGNPQLGPVLHVKVPISTSAPISAYGQYCEGTKWAMLHIPKSP